MKSRFLILMMGLLMVLAIGADAYAQATFTVSSGNTPRGRMNGHAELAGGVTLSHFSGTNVGTAGGSVIIDYGVPITNDIDDAANPITVDICTIAGDDGSVDVSGNTITVTVPAGDCTTTQSIDVSGVLLSLVGSGQESIVATVTSTGGVRLPSGSNMVSVINAIVDELTDAGVDTEALTLIRHTGDPEDTDKTMFKLILKENTVDSFEGTEIELEFEGIPDGVTLTLDAWVVTAKQFADKKVDQETNLATEGRDLMNDQVAIGGEEDMEDEVTATNNETTVFVERDEFTVMFDADDDPTTQNEETLEIDGGDLDATAIDVVIIQGSIDLGDDDNLEELLPLNLDIQVTADVGPIGDDDDTDDVPRFASDKTTAVTVIESTSDQVTMKVAYVLSDGPFDTGIAVANMTSGMTAQSGAVHFALYAAGEVTEHSTGMLGPQSTMSMLLSEVLTAAGHTGAFSGYMVITTDFNAADAGVFISDFVGFTAGATVRNDSN